MQDLSTSSIQSRPSHLPARLPCPQRPSEDLEVLDFTDIDDSLRTDDKAGLEQARQAKEDWSRISREVTCTGRGPTMSRALATTLAGFKLDAHACNNGLNLFVNQEGKPAEEFLSGLRLEDQDQGWLDHVKKIVPNWSVEGVQALTKDLLVSQGFQPAAALPPPRDSFTCLEKFVGGQSILVALPPDQPGYQVRCSNGPVTRAHEQFGYELAGQVGRQLTQQNVDYLKDVREGRRAMPEGWAGKTDAQILDLTDHIHGSFFEGGDRYTNFFTPKAITKAVMLEYLAGQRWSSTRYAIGTGDLAPNDTHLNVQQAGQAQVYSILALPPDKLNAPADATPRMAELADHPRLVRAPAGNVGPTIDTLMEKILGQMKAYPSERC